MGASKSITEGNAGRNRTGRKRQDGPKNPFWRGGRSIASNGYVLIRVGAEHHLADVRGYAYEHRVVAEMLIGRELLPKEQDNRPENLEVCTNLPQHRTKHRNAKSRLRLPEEANPHVACACGCGVSFRRYDSLGRPRRFVSGHNRRREVSRG